MNVRIYVYICICIFLYVRLYISMHVRIYACMNYVSIYAYMQIYMHICFSVYVNVCIDAFVYTRLLCIYICMIFACMEIRVYEFTYMCMQAGPDEIKYTGCFTTLGHNCRR